LKLPVEFLKATAPTAVLQAPVTLQNIALAPTAVLLLAVVAQIKALAPRAKFPPPDVMA
jgi:hypothetical protein